MGVGSPLHGDTLAIWVGHWTSGKSLSVLDYPLEAVWELYKESDARVTDEGEAESSERAAPPYVQ